MATNPAIAFGKFCKAHGFSREADRLSAELNWSNYDQRATDDYNVWINLFMHIETGQLKVCCYRTGPETFMTCDGPQENSDDVFPHSTTPLPDSNLKEFFEETMRDHLESFYDVVARYKR